MKAVILVGGQGTRLQPLTCNTPKAMVPILLRPFLEHMLRYLSSHKVNDIVLAMGYLPDPIKKGLGDIQNIGVRLIYSVEKSPMGTAGAVKYAAEYLDEPFFVFNGDVFTEIDLTEMMKKHLEYKPKVTIALTPVENPTVYGVVETDSQGFVKRFVEKPSWDKVTSNMVNAGVYIVEPDVLDFIPPETASMFEHNLFPFLLENNYPILAFPSDAYWIDIGTPKKYLQVQRDILSRNPRSEFNFDSGRYPGLNSSGAVIIGDNCKIEKNVKFVGPAVIGPNSQIGDNTVVDGAILWGDCYIGSNVLLKSCIIATETTVEDDCQILEECIVGNNVTVGKGSKLAPGARIWPSTCIRPNSTKF